MGLLAGILLLISAVFRIPALSSLPPELFGDEVDVGYQAISLYHTGRDYYNQPLPVYLHSFSEWRQPLIVYQLVPTVALFGNSPWAVRLPEALFGTITPVLLFLFIRLTGFRRLTAFLSGLVLSLTPWHILYSRMAAFGVVTLTDFLLLALLLYYKRRYILSFIFFALCLYTYSTALIFVPLLLFSLLIIKRPHLKPLSFLPLLLLIIPIVYFIIIGPARERGALLSFSSQSQFIDQIQQLRAEYPPLMGRLLSNKISATLILFGQNYLRAFSTDFLFVRGDPVVRSSLQVVGQLLPFTAPFILVGLYFLIKHKKWLWIIWLLIAPIPSALTYDGAFHATRLFLLVLPLCVASGVGLGWFLSRFRGLSKHIILFVLIMSFGYQIFNLSMYYIFVYPKVSWRWWPTGYSTIMADLAKNSSNFSKVFINNTFEPSLARFLFWTGYSPERFHQQFILDQPVDQVVPGYRGFSLGDKYYFGDFQTADHQPFYNSLQPDSLYLISQRDNVPGDWDWSKDPPADVRVLSIVRTPYGDPLFYLITKK